MGKESNERTFDKETTSAPAPSATVTITKAEQIVTDLVKAYLDSRDRRKQWEGALVITLFTIHLLITICIFYVIYDIHRMNEDYIKMKTKATNEMVEQYQKSLDKQERALKEWKDGN